MNSYKSVSQTTSIDNTEWICSTCHKRTNGDIPKLSIYNKMGFPKKPPELQLHQLEETLIAPIIPFMSIWELPVGFQKCLPGNVLSCTS